MPESVKVLRIKVLNTLKTNKEQHRKDFEEAMTVWIEKAKEKVKDVLSQLNSDKASDVNLSSVNLPKPVSFEKEYEKTIKMIELEVRPEIDISSYDFERFFLDNWDWKNNFLSNTMIYKK